MLQKYIIRLAFLTSVCFLLLHNLTPHMHHSELSDEEHALQHEGASSWYDWLMLGFHDDLGGGHLECYSDIVKITLTPKCSFIIPIDLLISDPSSLATPVETVNQIIRKNPYFMHLLRQQAYFGLSIFKRPPPTQ